MPQPITIGICQMQMDNDKAINLLKAENIIEQAVKQGANLVVLPEVFQAPYQADLFRDYAEEFPGPQQKCWHDWQPTIKYVW